MKEVRLVDANALRKTFEIACIYGLPMNELYGAILKIIDNAPTITPDKIQALMSDYLVYRCEPERPKGEWIYHTNGYAEFYTCNKCNKISNSQDKFCKHCGADMRGDNNDKSSS